MLTLTKPILIIAEFHGEKKSKYTVVSGLDVQSDYFGKYEKINLNILLSIIKVYITNNCEIYNENDLIELNNKLNSTRKREDDKAMYIEMQNNNGVENISIISDFKGTHTQDKILRRLKKMRTYAVNKKHNDIVINAKCADTVLELFKLLHIDNAFEITVKHL